MKLGTSVVGSIGSRGMAGKARALLCVLTVGVFAAGGSAAVVPLGNSGWTASIPVDLANLGYIGLSVDDPDATLDGKPAVIIELSKQFVGDSDIFGLFQPVYFEFKKTEPDAYDDFLIVIKDEVVKNDSSGGWDRFRMTLMVDLLDPEAGFDPTFPSSSDKLPTATWSDFWGYDPGPGALPTSRMFSGGWVPNTPDDQDLLRIAEPSDEMIVIVPDPALETGRRVVLKEIAIPEPTTLVFLSLSGLGLMFTKNGRRTSSPDQ